MLAPAALRAQRGGSPSYSELFVDAGMARVRQESRTARAPDATDAGTLGVGAQRVGRTISYGGELAATLVREPEAVDPRTGPGVRASPSALTGALQAAALGAFTPAAAEWFRTDVAAVGTRFGVGLGGLSAVGGSNRAGLWRGSLSRGVGPVSGGVSGTVAASSTSRSNPSGPPSADLRFRATSTEFGGWLSHRWLTLSIVRTRTLTDDYPLVEAAGMRLIRPAGSYDVRDVVVTGGVRVQRIALQAAFSRRAGGSATAGGARARNVSASVALTRSFALVATHGDLLADMLRGVPQSRMSSVALRWRVGGGASGGMRANQRVLSPGPLVEGERAGGVRAAVERVPAGGAVLTIEATAPRDAVVEYGTSQNDWMPTRATFDGRVHVARIDLPSGVHRVSVRVNGGTWQAPAGLVRERDEFGGWRGLVVVP